MRRVARNAKGVVLRFLRLHAWARVRLRLGGPQPGIPGRRRLLGTQGQQSCSRYLDLTASEIEPGRLQALAVQAQAPRLRKAQGAEQLERQAT
eukprot:CAMPEP_0171140310 /NCGR_PEP_ID=MMETSP0766_2-20121228/138476_1 /TAXON_ID=439317 /ORGANISM="Gambierdiscus australes, Strain CAWD 149" /LENGTH=92 /DNA_ID=CAMNT_0011603995 /DNA_START=210 /DNA_END=485 /DNA_ORIENTATION=-